MKIIKVSMNPWLLKNVVHSTTIRLIIFEIKPG